MSENNEVTDMVEQFMKDMKLEPTDEDTPDVHKSQFDVVTEEFREVQTSFIEWKAYTSEDMKGVGKPLEAKSAELLEELADLRVTIDLLAEMIGGDIVSAERAKMEYNLQKSGAMDEDGKIVDDTDIEKPDFTQFLDEGGYK